MAQPKRTAYLITNTQAGPRGIWSDGVLTYIDPDQTVPGSLTDDDKALADATGYFDIVAGGADPSPEPGPLDGNVNDLEAHVATLTDADDVQKLIDAETAGKSRKGALAVLEARRDAILAG